MKLQRQYNKASFISIISVLLIAAAGYYFLIRYVLLEQLDEALKVEEVEILDHVQKYNKIPEATIYKDQRITFEKTDHQVRRNFRSLEAFHPEENEMELSRQLRFTVHINGEMYVAYVTKSEESTEDLVWIIVFSTFAILVLLTMILFFINRYYFKKIWKPFRATLSAIKEFNLSNPKKLAIQSTTITEFRELNESVELMAHKVIQDYTSLKSFTDHASHEIQTPLAVIGSKLDVLIQHPELSEKSMQEIQGIYAAVDKLSKLTQSLLLMTRIGNNQFERSEKIFINIVAEDKINEVREWTDNESITINLTEEPLAVEMSKELAGIMISNLLRNAIRHSTAADTITVKIAGRQLTVSNSGQSPLDPQRIFTPFYKSDQSAGHGLGLAIVKSICVHYGFAIGYRFVNKRHEFSIQF